MTTQGRNLDEEFASLRAFSWDRELAAAREAGDAARIIQACKEVERRGKRRWVSIKKIHLSG